MEFLRTCNTNAQAIGDFEAIAYQAFSITRNPSSPLPDWNPLDDIRAVEAKCRECLHLVVQDTSRPWLWLFQPTTVDKASQAPLDLPELAEFRFQREQTGSMKSTELARPPLRVLNPNIASGSSMSSTPTGSHKSMQTGGGRTSQPNATEQQPPIDYYTVYELFMSSVIALISFHLVKDCNVVTLNYRTFVSKPPLQQNSSNGEPNVSTDIHWLTSINVHWTGSGTLLVSTFTEQAPTICCVEDVTLTDEQKQLLGACVRVAPNGMLARIINFDDPLEFVTESTHRQKKRARFVSLEQNIEKWKSIVTRWLAWKGYTGLNLDKTSSWVRIRTTQLARSVVSSPLSPALDRDMLWPRALCFFYTEQNSGVPAAEPSAISAAEVFHNTLKWFETSDSTGFKDPFDVAQEWFLGRPDREKMLETRKKAIKAEEESARRKEEQIGLFPSSPLNSRSGVYGDLQVLSGVYPTPPDGIIPGTVVSYSDTPSVSGTTSNIILAPGGGVPAINLSGPQDHAQTDNQLPLTSPILPAVSENLRPSSGNDDLFEDTEEDRFVGDGVNDSDFDFFDEDVDMLDVPPLPDIKNVSIKQEQDLEPMVKAESPAKEGLSDPLTALENILATASHNKEVVEQLTVAKEEEPVAMPDPPAQEQQTMITVAKDMTLIPEEAIISKDPTPPLSPIMVAKTLQLLSSTNSTPRSHQKRGATYQRDSAFDPVLFSRKLSISDAKYHDERLSVHRGQNVLDQPRRKSSTPQVKSLQDIPLLTKLRYAVSVASAQKIPQISSLAHACSDDSDLSSDSSGESDAESDAEEETESKAFAGSIALPTKRKLPVEDNATPLSVTSFAESFGGDWQDLYGLQLDEAHLIAFEPNTWDWSLISFPPPTEGSLHGARFSMPALPLPAAQLPDTPTSQPELLLEAPEDKHLNGKDSIAIAQIVTEQIVSATLDILGEDIQVERRSSHATSAETRWHLAIKNIFPNAADCNLPGLAAIHDTFPDLTAQAKGQQRPLPRKPNDGTAIPGNHMYQFNPPYVRIRRAEMHWDLLPPAMAFWEPLGLSPVNPPKNIVTFCVYPHSDSLRPCLETFFLNLQLTYDSCKLGSHARVETVVEFRGGLVPCKVSMDPTPREIFKAIRDTCVQLGKLLAIQHAKIREQQDSKIDAFVIYMVDSFGDASGLWELCSAFWALFQAYGQGPLGRSDQVQKPDLVLQIIPMKYIASFDVPVILDPAIYINLAREVYDRCPPSAPSGDKSPLNIYTAPAFQLEEALPRTVQFKLLAEPPADLLRENSYMHLGYAISLDGTWITAAWTDSCGKSQAVVSYHLGTRVFGEIAKEIWQTTIEILQSRRVHWRVCVAKAGVMDREEFETWAFLISCPTHLNLFITLLTVDTDPPYKLTPTMMSTSSTVGQPPVNTPGSTPQAGVSPDPAVGLTPAATPSADTTTADASTDPDARLIDVTDETWGVILAHRLHNSNSTNQFSPALISGLLVKRGETHATSNSSSHPIPDPEHGPIVVGVNILWIGAVGSTRAATSPFPPSGADGVSPGGGAVANPYAAGGSAPPSPSPVQDGVRSTSSLTWTPTVQMRATAENLLKEMLGQFRALGLLAKLRGVRGTRHGTVPWHIATAKRGVLGLGRVVGGG